MGLITEDIKEILRPDLQVTSLLPSAILNYSKMKLIVKVEIEDLPKKCQSASHRKKLSKKLKNCAKEILE